jgi:hypothetical protein
MVKETDNPDKISSLTAPGDPAYEMYRQATLGDVDFITGDYLAGKKARPKPKLSNPSSTHT